MAKTGFILIDVNSVVIAKENEKDGKVNLEINPHFNSILNHLTNVTKNDQSIQIILFTQEGMVKHNNSKLILKKELFQNVNDFSLDDIIQQATIAIMSGLSLCVEISEKTLELPVDNNQQLQLSLEAIKKFIKNNFSTDHILVISNKIDLLKQAKKNKFKTLRTFDSGMLNPDDLANFSNKITKKTYKKAHCYVDADDTVLIRWLTSFNKKTIINDSLINFFVENSGKIKEISYSILTSRENLSDKMLGKYQEHKTDLASELTKVFQQTDNADLNNLLKILKNSCQNVREMKTELAEIVSYLSKSAFKPKNPKLKILYDETFTVKEDLDLEYSYHLDSIAASIQEKSGITIEIAENTYTNKGKNGRKIDVIFKEKKQCDLILFFDDAASHLKPARAYKSVGNADLIVIQVHKAGDLPENWKTEISKLFTSLNQANLAGNSMTNLFNKQVTQLTLPSLQGSNNIFSSNVKAI